MRDIETIEAHLRSRNKSVRLKAVGLMLRHPDATPLQLVQCLCSSDNRNFEFQHVFELGESMRASWKRIHGVEDAAVYSYLRSLYTLSPEKNMGHVCHVLEQIGTPRAATLLAEIRKQMKRADANNTPDGIRQPANGSPKASV